MRVENGITPLNSSKELYSGTAVRAGEQWIVEPNRLRCGGVLYLSNAPQELEEGDVVLYTVETMPERRMPVGEAIFDSLIGKKDRPGTDVTAILRSHRLHEEFPEAVLAEVKEIPQRLEDAVMEKELSGGRRDLRFLPIVTIDGADTKDVDDGVSLECLPNGNYQLGVHIADVSYYVRPGSALDREAYARGTSVYLVDRVLPMLPKELSNGICSLNVGEDRLAYTVMMEVNSQGEVVRHEIFESLICVQYKITYDQLYDLLEEENAELTEVYRAHLPTLRLMRELAGILREKRRKRGALDFHFDETKVELDEAGRPTAVYPARITFANQVIEEFMLLCNETVAEEYAGKNVPFLYRVHEDPDPEKLETLALSVRAMGYTLKKGRKITPKVIQNLLWQAEGTPGETAVNTLALRALQKAEYSGDNKGHFGLAAEYYCHYTSPIRRYPDLLIHRIMKLCAGGALPRKQDEYYRKNLPDLAQHCSVTERSAAEAEMESVELKQVEFMEPHLGETFEAVVSGVTSFGLFVKLPNTVEGLLPYSAMPEYFRFDEARLLAIGERSGQTFRMGQSISVVLARVDVPMRQLEFTLASLGKKSLHAGPSSGSAGASGPTRGKKTVRKLSGRKVSGKKRSAGKTSRRKGRR